MSKPLKIVLITAVTLLILAIAGVFVADVAIKSKIEKFLQNSVPENLEITYDELEVSIWNGRVVVVHPKIKNFGDVTNRMNAKLDMDSLIIDGFDYWEYFFNNNVTIKSLELRQPKLNYFHNQLVDKKAYKYSKLEGLSQNITIGRVNVQKGDLTIRNFDTDSILLKTEKFTANVMDVHLDSQTVKRRIPFLFNTYNVHFDNLYYQLSDYETIEVKSSRITKNQSSFKEIKLYTKYSVTDFNRRISVERDHFEIDIKSIRIENQDFGYKQDSLFYFMSPKIEFTEPHLNIYRNKLITDDNSIKLLYSKMLRNLNFDLTLSEVLIKNATINYSEKVKPESSAGMVSFSKLYATIDKLSNTNASGESTTINIEAVFMKSTPIKIDWYFDVHNVNDQFIFKAEIGKLPAQDLNPFSQPNLKVKFEGELLKTYFTIDGNVHDSNIDLRTNYEDFKVLVLQKDGKVKNKFLSVVANLFIKKTSDKEQDHFREGMKKNVERDQTKSVFNFIWLSASAGLLNALTGDGKK